MGLPKGASIPLGRERGPNHVRDLKLIADVGIKDGKIAEIGRLNASAARTDGPKIIPGRPGA